jgi:hypothetical protein
MTVLDSGTVTVSVVDPGGTARGLSAHLPPGWTIRALADLADAIEVDLLVLGAATGPVVARARRLHPYSQIVGVIDQAAPADVIVDVLGAGADACVRAGSAEILAGHLRACHRRHRRRQTGY